MSEQIHIEMSGIFKDRNAAAKALEEAAEKVRSGDWQASQPVDANPQLFITSS